MNIHIILYLIVVFILPYVLTNYRFVYGDRKCIYKKEDIRKSEKIVIIGSFLFFLLIMFRNGGGIDDTNIYIKNFYIFNKGTSYVSYYEIFYQLICHMVHWVGGSYKMVFFIYGILTAYFWGQGLKYFDISCEEISIYFAVVFISGYVMIVTIMNQMLAVAILFYAVSLQMQGREKFSILFYIFAFFVHESALIGVLMFVCVKWLDIKNKWFYLMVPFILLGIASLIPILINKFLILIPESLRYVIKNIRMVSLQNISQTTLLIFFVYICLILMSNINTWKREERITILFSMIYISLIFGVNGIRHMERIATYFIFYVPFIFIYFFRRFKKDRYNKVLKVIFYIGTFLFFIYILKNANEDILRDYSGSIMLW